MAKVVAASRKAGKKVGVFSVSGEQAKMFADQGFDLISVATDYLALGAVMHQSLSVAKGGKQ